MIQATLRWLCVGISVELRMWWRDPWRCVYLVWDLFSCVVCLFVCCFFFNDTATTEIYTLSLHDALPISPEPSTGEPAYFISPAGSPAPTPPPSVAEAREGSPDYSLPPTPPPSVAECRYDTPAYTPPPTPEPSIGKKWSKITSVLSLRLEKITHGGNGDLISDSCWVIRCSVTIRMYHSDRCWVEL